MYVYTQSFIHQTFIEQLAYIQHCGRSQEDFYNMSWLSKGGKKVLETNNYNVISIK